MPFDSLPQEPAVVTNPDVELLDKMIALLPTPRQWTRCRFKRYGRRCILGAAYEALGAPNTCGHFAREIDLRVNDLLFPGASGAVNHAMAFNDRSDITHADVLLVLHAARQRALRGS